MEKLISLKNVSSSILPKHVLVLMAKYAQAAYKHSGVTIELSSVDVFEQIHTTRRTCGCRYAQRLHHELLILVNQHLTSGTMQTKTQGSHIRQFELIENNSIGIH